jgi:hypothetical protein
MDEKKIVPLLTSTKAEDVPDYYTNESQVKTSLYDVLIDFRLRTGPEVEPKSLVHIRMSPQQAKVLSIILTNHISYYERDIGQIKIPDDLVKQLGVDKRF